MLSEIALAPQQLDGALPWSRDEQGDFYIKLGRLLGAERNAPCPLIISNLHGGKFEEEAIRVVGSISEQKIRYKLQSLLVKIKGVLVTRPPRGAAPISSEDWSRAAREFQNDLPIQIIIDCAKAADELLRGDITYTYDLDPVISEQVDALAPIALHSDVIAFASPYVSGSDDDLHFFCQLAARAFSRSNDFRLPVVHLHTKRLMGSNNVNEKARRGRIEDAMRRAGLRGKRISLFIWNELLERVLLGGSLTSGTAGIKDWRCRWLIAISHVARRRDLPGDYKCLFALRPPDTRLFYFQRFYNKRPERLDDIECF